MRTARRQPEPRIETERLVLRPPRESDLGDIVAAIADYDIARMTTRIPHPYVMADAIDFLESSRRSVAAGGVTNLAVVHEDRLIGICSLFAMPYRPEIGYWFARRSWGRGFATETGRALLAYGFDALRLPIVHYRVFSDNPASARVAAKLGFRRVGFGISRSLARGAEVAHIHAVLTAARFRAANRTL